MTNLTTEMTIKTLNSKLTEMARLTAKHIDFLITTYVPVTDELMETGEIDLDKLTDMFWDMYGNYMNVYKKLETVLAIVDSEPELKDNEEVIVIVEQAKEFDKLTYGLNRDVTELVMLVESGESSTWGIVEKSMGLRKLVMGFIKMKEAIEGNEGIE